MTATLSEMNQQLRPYTEKINFEDLKLDLQKIVVANKGFELKEDVPGKPGFISDLVSLVHFYPLSASFLLRYITLLHSVLCLDCRLFVCSCRTLLFCLYNNSPPCPHFLGRGFGDVKTRYKQGRRNKL